MKQIILLLILAAFSYASEIGTASYYSTNTGSRTASGEVLSDKSFTAAHKTLKFGTKVKVTNLNNGRTLIVKINNRGPFKRGRIIDLTIAGAKHLGFYQKGLTKVKLEVICK
jgi:rare lipoprotein A